MKSVYVIISSRILKYFRSVETCESSNPPPHNLPGSPSFLALSNEPKLLPEDCHNRRYVSIDYCAQSFSKDQKLTVSSSGAGVGGVAAAARLAKAGVKVTVFEKNDFTGGRCSLVHHEGYVSDLSYLWVH